MKLHELTKTTIRSSKRLGRGMGSGRGKTAGRGTKGQKARGKIPTSFIGGTLPLYKKLPFRKGKGNIALSKKPMVLNLKNLNGFKANSEISLESLLQQKIITERGVRGGVKILGMGEISKALIFKLPVSNATQKKIERVGGRVE